MESTDQDLTQTDIDWLRRIRAACDAQRAALAVPAGVAGKLCAFRLVKPDASGGAVITDRGRGVLLEQDMRDAEER